jgi:hypothetical protein
VVVVNTAGAGAGVATVVTVRLVLVEPTAPAAQQHQIRTHTTMGAITQKMKKKSTLRPAARPTFTSTGIGNESADCMHMHNFCLWWEKLTDTLGQKEVVTLSVRYPA